MFDLCHLTPSIRWRRAGAGGVGGGTTVTWNPADISTNSVTLSGGNLIFTNTSAGAFSSVRATLAKSGGGFFFEVTVNTIVASGQEIRIGLGNSGVDLNANIGAATACLAYHAADGQMTAAGGSGVGTGALYAANDKIGFLYESATSVKCYKNGVQQFQWTGGQIPTAPLFPIAMTVWNTDQVTANFGASAFSFQPAGSTSWDGSRTA